MDTLGVREFVTRKQANKGSVIMYKKRVSALLQCLLCYGVASGSSASTQLPPATGYGWKTQEDRLVLITTMDPPATASITHLVKCGYKKDKCWSNCSCRSQNLSCSEICMCSADEGCDNVSEEHAMGIDDDEHGGDPSI